MNQLVVRDEDIHFAVSDSWEEQWKSAPELMIVNDLNVKITETPDGDKRWEHIE